MAKDKLQQIYETQILNEKAGRPAGKKESGLSKQFSDKEKDEGKRTIKFTATIIPNRRLKREEGAKVETVSSDPENITVTLKNMNSVIDNLAKKFEQQLTKIYMKKWDADLDEFEIEISDESGNIGAKANDQASDRDSLDQADSF